MSKDSWDGLHEEDYGQPGTLICIDEHKQIINIASYTTINFYLVDPSENVTGPKAGAHETDGTDGKVTYVIADGDLPVAGYWKVFARISKPDSVLTTDPHTFYVRPRLDN